MEMLARPLSELFGDYTAAAEALRNDHATKVQQLVALLIARAKHAFSDRYVDPDAGERGAELAALDRLTTVMLAEEHDMVAIDCPACGRVGILSGSAALEWEIEEIGEEGARFTTFVDSRAVLSASGFRCPVCGLRLIGSEQLAEANIGTEVELGPEQMDNLMAHYAAQDAEVEEAWRLDEQDGDG